MTRSETPERAYVWAWLPDATTPVVAGVVRATGADSHHFRYAKTYLDRPDRISLFEPELPLQSGWIDPPEGLTMAGSLWDASPDSWGQRVITARLAQEYGGNGPDLGKLTFLLESGSNRIGGLDFQDSPVDYVARDESATLDELHDAALALEAGELRPELAQALVDGTAVGGARPKVLVLDKGVEYIAKLSLSADPYPVVKAEAAAMTLARYVGIDAPSCHVVRSLGRDVLLVERFDRTGGGRRHMMISALTMLGFGDFLGARYSSYPDLLDILRQRSTTAHGLARGLFERIVFNIVIGNTDDHARNHAAFWDGKNLDLTPAYDLCPQLRTGREANQAMDINRPKGDPAGVGDRRSRFATCLEAAHLYGLSEAQARDVIDTQVSIVRERWDEACDAAKLTAIARTSLLGRQILNPYTFDGYPIA